MRSQAPNKKNFDVPIFAMMTILVFIGLLMVFSATSIESINAGDPFFYLKKQIIYLILGFASFFAAYNIDYKNYRKYTGWLLAGAFLLLVAVFVPTLGRSAGGATRWLNLGPISFQPSEIVKLILAIYFADIISKRMEHITDYKKVIIPVMTVTGFACLIVLAQSDLGTATIIFLSAVFMLYLAGARITHLISLGFLAVLAFAGATLSSAYRVKRFTAYLDPWSDPKGTGFHIIQSLIAIGSGGLAGLGLGASRQKFLYLPEQYTDFIFAIICEEMGFIGAVFVIAVFIAFISRAIIIARSCEDVFGRMLAYGITSYIGLQAAVNMSVVVGLIPTTGIPLPFISYGGTSLIVLMFATGILMNISSVSKRTAKERSFAK